MPALEPQVHVAIRSRLENIELVQIAVEASLSQLDVDADTAHWIGIAVREAVANAIEHGNQGNPKKNVEVEFGLVGDDVVIQVRDQGRGFNPEALPNPLAADNLLRPDGRGIFFMRKFMDEIDYSFKPTGTVVTLRKRLRSDSAASGEKEIS